ncbi:transmembrane protein 87B-like isoform X1 [Carex littledalei]|uniref:Transmembrane protein 87B-like isoform X1 n=1 Tax=Carex littledalei TaxID=544730 RepID=A0A833VIX8_9POAL|nr:transmembrane protein 87B-like isoform X1 [Carex littledalei]
MHRKSHQCGLLLNHLGFLLGFVILIGDPNVAIASIHDYTKGVFVPLSNSFFFHGGSEGHYASSDRHSFIRFESVTFKRTKESTALYHDKQQKTGLVEAIIVESQDRDKIGGAYFNSDQICCTAELHVKKYCKVGEVIINPRSDNSEWPKRIQTFFDGKNEETSMVNQTVYINRTGMYYVYFMFCDPDLDSHGMTTISGRTVWQNQQGFFQYIYSTCLEFLYALVQVRY